MHRHREFDSTEKLAERMKRDITGFMRDHLEYLQGFEHVKVYYGNGQAIVKSTLYDAVHEMLAKQAVVSRRTTMTEYRLS